MLRTSLGNCVKTVKFCSVYGDKVNNLIIDFFLKISMHKIHMFLQCFICINDYNWCLSNNVEQKRLL